jgi:Domain of unknown function (DUF1707)
MAEPGDHRAAAAGGRGRLRASHADREQAIEVLKDAFAQGRLTEDELDSRVGQAFASRTYAELAALTADLPADPAAAPPPRQPARAHDRAPGTHLVRNAAIGSGAGLIFAGALFLSAVALDDHAGVALLLLAAFIVIVVVPGVMISAVATSLQQRRSRGQLPPRPGQGGQGPEAQQPGQVGHDPAPPGARPDQTCADLRTDRSRPGRPHPSGLAARAPRDIRPVPGAV